uniref:UvrD-like helicase, ATP-binding domain, P-loop containing nucleoside triphosphate hydrolase n=1 Tax=Tanacetum cinerariifolium TaxID=118510 RepID=A0A6L2KLD9_TANCI|nr:UvrD-like helicase, ATP-binding domain, P-loop containing nucleoside triphosphate hydrolase [Tanacetum cinerariifolium]
MGHRRSKEDHVQQVSQSIFVTNFPDHFFYRDLWRVCEEYGKVIDVYIPNRRLQSGKCYAFVRYVKIANIDKVVENLCAAWIGRLRVTWVDIDGIPLCIWTQQTFTRIASKWGMLLYAEENDETCLHRKCLCVKLKSKDNIFESFKIIVQGEVYWVRAKEVTGWLPEFNEEEKESYVSNEDVMGERLNEVNEEEDCDEEKKKGSNGVEQSECNMKFPPGFTPPEDVDDHDLMDGPFSKSIDAEIRGFHFRVDGEFDKGGIVCVLDPQMFSKDNVTVSDSFIAIKGGLVNVPLGGYNFTWSHETSTKMNKLDRFLVSEGLMERCHHVSATCLDRFVSDHRPILLREELDHLESMEIAHKPKVRWAIEGDENSKYFYGILNVKMASGKKIQKSLI